MSLPLLFMQRCWGPTLPFARNLHHAACPASEVLAILSHLSSLPLTPLPNPPLKCHLRSRGPPVPLAGSGCVQSAPAMWWEAARLQHVGPRETRGPLCSPSITAPSWGRRRGKPAWVRQDMGEPALTHRPSPRRRELHSQHF